MRGGGVSPVEHSEDRWRLKSPLYAPDGRGNRQFSNSQRSKKLTMCYAADFPNQNIPSSQLLAFSKQKNRWFREGRMVYQGKDGILREGWYSKGRMVQEGKDGLGREGWFRKGRLVQEGKAVPVREGWNSKGRMVQEGKDVPVREGW